MKNRSLCCECRCSDYVQYVARILCKKTDTILYKPLLYVRVQNATGKKLGSQNFRIEEDDHIHVFTVILNLFNEQEHHIHIVYCLFRQGLDHYRREKWLTLRPKNVAQTASQMFYFSRNQKAVFATNCPVEIDDMVDPPKIIRTAGEPFDPSWYNQKSPR